MVLYIENSKDPINKISELINEFGKVAEYKTNSLLLRLCMDCFLYLLQVFGLWLPWDFDIGIHTHTLIHTHTHTHYCFNCWSLDWKCISSILHLYPFLLMFFGLVAYLWVDDFLLLPYVCLYWWAFSFIIFLLLVVAFSFHLKKFP